MALSEAQLLRQRLAAHSKWAQQDPVEGTARARQTWLESFEHQVDPDGSLPMAERKRRAEHALKAHMLRLSLQAVKARKAKEGGDAA